MRVLGIALERLWFVMAPCTLVVVLALAGSSAPDETVLLALVNVVLVVGLYSFAGLSGVLSFGHMSFMAVGAYVAALLTLPPTIKELLLPALPDVLERAEVAPLAAALVGGAAAAMLALVLAGPLMRLSGLTAGLATVALLIVVRVVASNWQQVTNGTAGLAGVPTTTTLLAALAWAVAAIVLVAAFQSSPPGRRLRASREDEVAARSIGVRVVRERSVAFVLSAFLTGVAGALFAGVLGTVTPDQFYISLTFLIIAMLVIGGMTSLGGAVVGAAVVAVVIELLRGIEDGTALGPLEIPARPGLTEVGLALLLLVVLALRPAGITGGREIPWPLARRHTAAAAPQSSAAPSQSEAPILEVSK